MRQVDNRSAVILHSVYWPKNGNTQIVGGKKAGALELKLDVKQAVNRDDFASLSEFISLC